jgi:sugar phosphate isomerase/epimerase
MYDETFLNRGAEYLDRFKENLEIAVESEAPLMMIPPFARNGNMGPESDRREWIGYFSEIFPLASKARIPLALESTGLLDSPIISADDILEVLHAIPGMKVVFDNGNTSTADDPLAAFERLLPWIIHIHFKDSQISDVSKAGFTVRRNGKYMRQASIGTGSQDLHAIFRMLKETGYDKWITLESSDPDRSIPIKDVLKENIRLIKLWEKEYADE